MLLGTGWFDCLFHTALFFNVIMHHQEKLMSELLPKILELLQKYNLYKIEQAST